MELKEKDTGFAPPVRQQSSRPGLSHFAVSVTHYVGPLDIAATFTRALLELRAGVPYRCKRTESTTFPHFRS